MFKWMFNREKKVYLQLTDEEYRLVRKYLAEQADRPGPGRLPGK